MTSKTLHLFYVAILSIFAVELSPAAELKNIQCGSGFSDSFQLASVTSQKMIVNLGVVLTGVEDLYPLERTSRGDCKKHSNYICYLGDQMMVNLPKNAFSLKGPQIKVWLNMDVDDDSTNAGLGVDYLCTVH